MKALSRLRRSLPVLLASVLTQLTHPAVAGPIGFNYEIDVLDTASLERGTLSAMVVGEDADGNNFFDFDEVSMFMLDWEGTTNLPAFSHTLSNVIANPTLPGFSFIFDFVGGGIGALLSCTVPDGGACDPGSSSVEAFGSAPDLRILSPGGGLGSIGKGGIVTEKPDAVPVPEPSTLALLGAGLFGLAISRRRRINNATA